MFDLALAGQSLKGKVMKGAQDQGTRYQHFKCHCKYERLPLCISIVISKNMAERVWVGEFWPSCGFKQRFKVECCRLIEGMYIKQHKNFPKLTFSKLPLNLKLNVKVPRCTNIPKL